MKTIFKEFKKNIGFFILIDLALWAGLFIWYLKPIREKYPIKIDKLTFREINDCKLTKKLEDVERRVFLDGLSISKPIDEYINLNDEVEIGIYKETDRRKNEKWGGAHARFSGYYDSKQKLDELLIQMVPQEQLEKNETFYMTEDDIYINIDESKSTIHISFNNFSMPYTHNYKEGIAFGSGRAKTTLKKVGRRPNEYFLTIESIAVRKTVFRDILENIKIIGIIFVTDIIILYIKKRKKCVLVMN